MSQTKLKIQINEFDLNNGVKQFNLRKCIKFDSNLVYFKCPKCYVNVNDVCFEIKIEMD